jgi:hypothetical protein
MIKENLEASIAIQRDVRNIKSAISLNTMLFEYLEALSNISDPNVPSKLAKSYSNLIRAKKSAKNFYKLNFGESSIGKLVEKPTIEEIKKPKKNSDE